MKITLHANAPFILSNRERKVTSRFELNSVGISLTQSMISRWMGYIPTGGPDGGNQNFDSFW